MTIEEFKQEDDGRVGTVMSQSDVKPKSRTAGCTAKKAILSSSGSLVRTGTPMIVLSWLQLMPTCLLLLGSKRKRRDTMFAGFEVFFITTNYTSCATTFRARASWKRCCSTKALTADCGICLLTAGVVKSLNNLYAAMGGREGFEKAVKDLGLEDDLAPYFEAFSKSAADLSYQVRNARLVEEMIAFTGQKDSKGLKLRLQELVGAIRNWFRERGYLSLAKATASDIAFIAKKARQQYFTSMTAGEGTAYSVKETGPRAEKTDQGLFSNAEQVLLEQGDKIFKPSKKNPEGAVRGDQILSFLKGRGLKRDELEYTQLEEFLTADGAPKRTKEEVIQYLQRNAPELREVVGVGFEGEGGGTPWSEAEVMDGRVLLRASHRGL